MRVNPVLPLPRPRPQTARTVVDLILNARSADDLRQYGWEKGQATSDGRFRWKGTDEHKGQYRTQKTEPGTGRGGKKKDATAEPAVPGEEGAEKQPAQKKPALKRVKVDHNAIGDRIEKMLEGDFSDDEVFDLKQSLLRLTVAQLGELKKRFGVKGGRTKADIAGRIGGNVEGKRKPAEQPASVEPQGDSPSMRPSIDHSLLSPSGTVSKRSREAALERTRKELFPESEFPNGIGPQLPTQPGKAEGMRAQAARLRELAERGMKPRAYRKEAERLEAEALALESQQPAPSQPAEPQQAQVGTPASEVPGSPEQQAPRLPEAPQQPQAEKMPETQQFVKRPRLRAEREKLQEPLRKLFNEVSGQAASANISVMDHQTNSLAQHMQQGLMKIASGVDGFGKPMSDEAYSALYRHVVDGLAELRKRTEQRIEERTNPKPVSEAISKPKSQAPARTPIQESSVKPAFKMADWLQGDDTAERLIRSMGNSIETGAYIGVAKVARINPPSKKYPNGSVRMVNSAGESDVFDFVQLRDRIRSGHNGARFLRSQQPAAPAPNPREQRSRSGLGQAPQVQPKPKPAPQPEPQPQPRPAPSSLTRNRLTSSVRSSVLPAGKPQGGADADREARIEKYRQRAAQKKPLFNSRSPVDVILSARSPHQARPLLYAWVRRESKRRPGRFYWQNTDNPRDKRYQDNMPGQRPGKHTPVASVGPREHLLRVLEAPYKVADYYLTSLRERLQRMRPAAVEALRQEFSSIV